MAMGASEHSTEEVYPHQLKPVITTGAETVNTVFGQRTQGESRRAQAEATDKQARSA